MRQNEAGKLGEAIQRKSVTSIKEEQDPESQIKCVIDLVESQIEEEKTNKNTYKDLDFFVGLKIRTHIVELLREGIPVSTRKRVAAIITGSKGTDRNGQLYVLGKWNPLTAFDEETEYKDDLGQWRPFSELLP